MKTFTKLFILGLFVFVSALYGCSSRQDVNDQLSEAEEAMDQGDYRSGTKICTEIAHTTDTAELSVQQLCRMAMIYASAADNDVDNASNMAAALHCFNSAIARDADSTSMFVENLPIDLQATARLALQLLKNHNEGGTTEDDNEQYIPADHDLDPDHTEAELELHEDIAF